MNPIERIHSVAHDWINILQDKYSFSEAEAEDFTYEALAEGLKNEKCLELFTNYTYVYLTEKGFWQLME